MKSTVFVMLIRLPPRVHRTDVQHRGRESLDPPRQSTLSLASVR
jgi:hypothetical protein